MMVYYLVALYNTPGVESVIIGDIIHRLLANSIQLVTCSKATEASGNLNLCDGLGSIIEGAAHATLSDYSKYQLLTASYQTFLAWGAAR